MTIPVELWPRISRLFDEALLLAPAERSPWLARLDVEHASESVHVRRLLAAHDRAAGDDGLRAPPAELVAAALAGEGAGQGLAPGRMLGPYRLLEPIGEGGMASVWLAEQTANVVRRVALKIPHAGLEDAAAMTARFAHERDFLAGLEHPHIARLYDAGASADGLPYLAMEWIDGVPITRYADANGLNLAARIELFLQVLQAVRFAHARLVIHRDLKPSNIIVTADGQVKLLDFGIARLLEDPLGDDASATGGMPRALTPQAASPEQLAGAPLGTASDVFSLGVVLYELLTGQRPYRLESPAGVGSATALHAALIATDIGVPSREDVDADAATKRGSTPAALRRALAGDLDAIVAKALMKDASLRYETAEAFAADLERHLRLEPVEARGGGWAYVAGRALRRHRGVAAAAGIALLSIGAGTAAVAWQARLAHAEADRANAVKDFLVQVFRASAPAQAKGRDVSAKELLALGSERIESALRDQPLAMAQLDDELGDIYNEMDDNAHALQHLNRAVDTLSKAGKLGSRDGLSALFHRGNVRLESARWDEARADLERCLQLGEANYGNRHRFAVAAREKLAFLELQLGHYERSLQFAEEALAQPVGEDAAFDALRRLRVRSVMGQTLTTMGRYADAEATFARVLADAPQVPAFSVVDVMVARLQMARAYHYDGDEQAALKQTRALVPELEYVLGLHHLITRVGRQVMSQALTALGRYDDAIAVQQANLDGLPAGNGEDGAIEQAVLAVAYRRAARFTEARASATQALKVLDARYTEPTQRRELVRRTLGEAEIGLGHVEEGTKLIEAARDNGQRVKGYEQSSDQAATLESLAVARRLADDWGQAQDLLNRACLVYRHSNRAESAAVLRCDVQRQWVQAMRAPDSDGSRSAYADAAARYAAILPADHVAHADLMLMQAELDHESHRSSTVDERAAMGAWQLAVKQPWPGHLVFIH